MFLFSFVPLALAEKATDLPISLQVYGEVTSVFKQQTNYRTPLDSKDRFAENGIERGSTSRHGANNRESAIDKSTRCNDFCSERRRKLLDVEGKDGDVYEFTGVFKLGYDANDPDTDDGFSKARVKQEDTWIRYSPHLAVGIKVGVQSWLPQRMLGQSDTNLLETWMMTFFFIQHLPY